MSFIIQIADLGLGNPKSIKNVMSRLNYNSELIKDSSHLNSDVFLLPGVGSFDYGIKKLREGNWSECIDRHIDKGGWIIGICLGMQILCESSDEGQEKGLNLIPGRFVKFESEKNQVVPHMGWNKVEFIENKKSLLQIDQLNKLNMRFYFVHSFHYLHSSNEYVSGTTIYGDKFPSIISKDRIIGCQFHPEKSHVYGFKLLTTILKQINSYAG